VNLLTFVIFTNLYDTESIPWSFENLATLAILLQRVLGEQLIRIRVRRKLR